MAASGSAAAISKVGDDGSLELVDGTVHRGHSVGHVEDVARVPRLGIQASPHLGGVDFNKVGELPVEHLMLIPGQPHQGPFSSSMTAAWRPSRSSSPVSISGDPYRGCGAAGAAR